MKYRKPFTVVYRDGKIESGVIYAEGNIKMDSGILFGSLRHVVTENVAKIVFPPKIATASQKTDA